MVKNKTLKYANLKEWRLAEPKAYGVACQRKLLPKICDLTGWVYRPHTVYKRDFWGGYISCRKKARQYKTIEEWKNNHYKSYDCAKRRKYLTKIKKELGWYVTQALTKEECLKRSLEFKTKLEWLKGDIASCKAAYRNNWIKGININQWTENKCKENALLFDNLNDWKNENTDVYIISLIKGWYRSSTYHIGNCVEKYWGKKTCIIEAKNYKTISEWGKKHIISYRMATRKGWLEECTKHMKKPYTKSFKE